jgi:hypothetical protein
MNSGYVKLWRKALDSDLYTFQDLRLPGLFHWLLLNANWRTGKWRGRDIPAGSCVVQTLSLAEELGVTRKVMRGLLAKLEELDMIRTENLGNRGTLISVLNWQKYQDQGPTKGQPNDTSRANQGPTEPTDIATGCDYEEAQAGPTKGQPNDGNRANQGPTINTEEGKKKSSPPIIPPRGVECLVGLDVPEIGGEAKRLGALFSAAHEAIRGRGLAATVRPYADLLCQRALSAGVSPRLVEEALAWLPGAHGRQGVPRIRDPRQLQPEWFESVADAKARAAAGRGVFQQADARKDYRI